MVVKKKQTRQWLSWLWRAWLFMLLLRKCSFNWQLQWHWRYNDGYDHYIPQHHHHPYPCCHSQPNHPHQQDQSTSTRPMPSSANITILFVFTGLVLCAQSMSKPSTCPHLLALILLSDKQPIWCWDVIQPEPGSKLLVLGMVIQPLIGNPYNGYINPYYWVDFPIPYYMENYRELIEG